jgi:hypothetical protein
LKGERNRRDQFSESQFKKSGTLTLLIVIVSLKGIERVSESFLAKYCDASFIALRFTRYCRFAL